MLVFFRPLHELILAFSATGGARIRSRFDTSAYIIFKRYSFAVFAARYIVSCIFDFCNSFFEISYVFYRLIK